MSDKHYDFSPMKSKGRVEVVLRDKKFGKEGDSKHDYVLGSIEGVYAEGIVVREAGAAGESRQVFIPWTSIQKVNPAEYEPVKI